MIFADLWLSQDVRKLVFGIFPSIFRFDTINEAHKQYSLLDTIFDYIFDLGPAGKYLYESQANLLHVGRLQCLVTHFLSALSQARVFTRRSSAGF